MVERARKKSTDQQSFDVKPTLQPCTHLTRITVVRGYPSHSSITHIYTFHHLPMCPFPPFFGAAENRSRDFLGPSFLQVLSVMLYSTSLAQDHAPGPPSQRRFRKQRYGGKVRLEGPGAGAGAGAGAERRGGGGNGQIASLSLSLSLSRLPFPSLSLPPSSELLILPTMLIRSNRQVPCN
jgi:hypothetical protein